MKEYTYFVSFVCNNQRHGNIVITLNHLICSSDLRSIENHIEKKYHSKDVIIMNYIRINDK